jgi:hypothetical protein
LHLGARDGQAELGRDPETDVLVLREAKFSLPI